MTKNDITIPTIFGAAAITASLFHHYPLMLMALVQLVLSVLFIAGRTWSLRRAQAYEASAPTVRREAVLLDSNRHLQRAPRTRHQDA